MEQYTNKEFDCFMKSMKKAADYLRSKKPDFIFAPIIGSIPLIDILSIIDRQFPLETIEYPPNSSRFIKREEIIDTLQESHKNITSLEEHKTESELSSIKGTPFEED